MALGTGIIIVMAYICPKCERIINFEQVVSGNKAFYG